MILTDTGIRALPAPTRPHFITDAHKAAPPGFGLRVHPGGARTFLLRYRSGGRVRWLRIGDWPTWTATAARTEAARLRREVDAGGDPADERAAAKVRPRTFGDVAERFLAEHADRLRSGAQLRWLYGKHVAPALADRPLAGVSRAEVIELVARLASGTPRVAAMTLGLVKQMLAFAADRELVEVDVAASIKPSRISRALGPRTRARVLTDDEIRTLWGLRGLTALALRLVLVTGQRPGEVAGLRDEEIAGTVWTIPAGRRKGGRPHAVPLTGLALALIAQAQAERARLARRRRCDPAPFLFEAREGRPLTAQSMAKAVARLGLGWTPHDLRRTCRTRLAALGVSPVVAEMVIGHQQGGIAGVYDRHTYAPEIRAALTAWAESVDDAIKGVDSTNVTS